MFWLQAIDELKSNEETQTFEGFACAIEYKTEFAFDTENEYKQLIPPNQLHRSGTVSTIPMQYALGTYEDLLEDYQTEE